MNLNTCRLCNKHDSILINVFDDDKKKNLSEKIYMCFGVQIKKDDPVTTKICKSCYFFTSTAFEYRLSSLENDAKLKKEYDNAQSKLKTKIETFPNDISQNDFLNSLKLTTNSDIHPSVERLKRKYPEIKISFDCNHLNLDPYVKILRKPIKKLKDDNVWSISSTKTSKSGLIFTMVKNDQVDSKNDEISSVIKKDLKRRRKISSSGSSCSNTNSSISQITSEKVAKNSSNNYVDIEKIIPCFDEEEGDGFSCPFCQKTFTNKKNIARHIKNIHNKTVSSISSKVSSNSSKVSSNSSKVSLNSSKVPSTSSEVSSNQLEQSSSKSSDVSLKPSEHGLLKSSEVSSNSSEHGSSKPLISSKPLEHESSKLAEISSKPSEHGSSKPLEISSKSSEHEKLTSVVIPLNSNEKIVKSIAAQMEGSSGDLKTLLNIDVQLTDSLSKLAQNKQILTETAQNMETNLLIQDEAVNAFFCLTCNQVFDSLEMLKYHKRYKHKSPLLRCNKCSKKFTVVEKLIEHNEIHNNYRRKREAADKARAERANKENIEKEVAANREEQTVNQENIEKEAETTVEEEIQSEEIADTEGTANIADNTNNKVNKEQITNLNKKHEKNKIPVKYSEDLSISSKKHAASLPQLSVTLEPLEYIQAKLLKNKKLENIQKLAVGRMVARKKTNGALFLTKSPVHEISSDDESTTSSSSSDAEDNDCEITEVSTPVKTDLKIELSKRNDMFFLDSALRPQMDDTTIENAYPTKPDTTGIVDKLIEISERVDKEEAVNTDSAEVEKTDVPATSSISYNDEIYLIDSDSESENNPKELKTANINSQLTVQLNPLVLNSTGEPLNNKNPDSFIDISLSCNETSSTPTNDPKSSNQLDCPILISALENNSKLSSTSSAMKKANELNYIDYIFNKCSFDEKTVTNGSQHWNLQNIESLTEYIALPIKINKVADPNISLKYTITEETITANSVPEIPWNYKNAIDLQIGVNNVTTKTKSSQSLIPAKLKTSVKVPIPASSALKTTIVVGPNNQLLTKYIPQTRVGEIRAKQLSTGNQQLAQSVETQEQTAADIQPVQNVASVQNAGSVPNGNSVQKIDSAPNIQNPKVSSPGRSVLKNSVVTNQPYLFTYIPTTSAVVQNQKYVTVPTINTSQQQIQQQQNHQQLQNQQQKLDQSLVINGITYQQMNNSINKSSTLLFQPIEQQKTYNIHNYINIAQPPTYYTTNTLNPTTSTQIYVQQPIHQSQQLIQNNVTQNKINQPENKITGSMKQAVVPIPSPTPAVIPMSLEQTNDLSSIPANENNVASENRPLIRIKSLSELRPKLPDPQQGSYLNVFASYVHEQMSPSFLGK